MKQVRTLYTWLGVEETASVDEINAAYKVQAKKHHPDRGGDVEIFQKINQARDVLLDEQARKKYDRKIRAVRRRLKFEGMVGSVQDWWSNLEDSFDDWESNIDYHAEQQALETEWQLNLARLINEYRHIEQMNAENLEGILHSTDVLLSSLTKSDRIVFTERQVSDDPIEIKIDVGVPLGDQAQSVLSDLKDTISQAEKLVRMFNNMTKKS